MNTTLTPPTQTNNRALPQRANFDSDEAFIDYVRNAFVPLDPPLVDRDQRRFDTFEQARALLDPSYAIGDNFKLLFRQPRIEQRTPEWFMARQNAITSSDFAAAIGANPWQSVHNLVQKKVTGSNSFQGNAATRYGVDNEDRALYRYEQETGAITFDFGLMSHSQLFSDMPATMMSVNEKKLEWFRFVHGDERREHLTWLKGSPDGVAMVPYVDESSGERRYEAVLVEIKCPLRTFKHQCITSYYYPQVQLLMYLLDLEKTHFVQYNRPSKMYEEKYDLLVVHRDRQWMQTAMEASRDVWDFTVTYRQYHPELIHTMSFRDALKSSDEEKEKEKASGTENSPARRVEKCEQLQTMFPACVSLPSKNKRSAVLTDAQLKRLSIK